MQVKKTEGVTHPGFLTRYAIVLFPALAASFLLAVYFGLQHLEKVRPRLILNAEETVGQEAGCEVRRVYGSFSGVCHTENKPGREEIVNQIARSLRWGSVLTLLPGGEIWMSDELEIVLLDPAIPLDQSKWQVSGRFKGIKRRRRI